MNSTTVELTGNAVQHTPATAATGSSKIFVDVQNMVKHFGTTVALKGVSLKVYEGELVVFLGPSGCGKTTLLRAIAGLDMQTSGSLTQDGKDISTLPPEERDFGIVFQSYALFPNLSVRENVGYGLIQTKMSATAINKRVDELLSMVDLADFGNRYPGQLSGGQQQRVAFVRAVATSPGLLLLDEPLSALDAKVRVHLRTEIKHLQRQLGLTTIMVTHDQEEALAMADRIVVMNHGVIEQVGTPEQIYQQPISKFVASFVGKVNFLSCEVISQDTVEVAGIELQISNTDVGIGTQALIAIRPEDISVRDVTGVGINDLVVTVQEIEFLGAFVRITVNHEHIGQLITDFSMNTLRDIDVVKGQKLTINLSQQYLRIYHGVEH
ncbi:MAG: putative 2-aminoethylphosphonate ABC transporter ATP-binding protein [Gammaproteobacteria bacterium]|nr:putative 2-aminoethylphosphonate ABC transporter ATP-binding protein [Gammaproteobacteria bacterium]